jgi:ferredoxin
MFGAVTPKTRRFAHTLATFEKFGNALIDIYSVIKPKLAVMDGVVGMEGEGPRHGDSKKVGLIIASHDPVALDAVTSKIIGFDPMEIATTRLATERGLGDGDLSRIEILGENIRDVAVDFKKPTVRRVSRVPLLVGLFDRFSKVEPELVKEKCIKCNICAKSCPVEAIKLNPYPEINREICIECYCCNELCPEGAMEIRKNWVIRFAEGRSNEANREGK